MATKFLMPRAIFILLVTALVPGCDFAPALSRVEPSSHAAFSQAPPGAAFARFNADPKRLLDDIPRAAYRLEWAMLHVEPSVRTGQTPPPLSPDKPIEAQALLPDDREASILAWMVSDKEVAVSVRVGHFGDPALEQKYLKTLVAVMADRPKPKRGGWFELPPLPPLPPLPSLPPLPLLNDVTNPPQKK